MKRRILTAAALTLTSAALLLAANPDESAADRFLRIAQRMTPAINRLDCPAIQRDFSPAMLDALPIEKAKPFFKNLQAGYGRILRLGDPHLIPPNQAIIPAYCQRGALDIKLVLDNNDKIAGLWFLPHIPPIPVPQDHKTNLDLPFTGKWLVVWGGDTRLLNQQHHDVPNQKFAFDFIGADNLARTRKGDGLRNEDFFAFGRPVLAPADGTVTDVIDGVRDNVPGSMNPYSALGNAVFIRHAENEVSVIAHFKQNSISVRPGQTVKKGQPLGLCGNSGNSSEPHIHYHLQNTPVIQDATGIKVFFGNLNVTDEGKTRLTQHYSPVKGDIIEPAP